VSVLSMADPGEFGEGSGFSAAGVRLLLFEFHVKMLAFGVKMMLSELQQHLQHFLM
jgi:hypothetical protein